MQKFITRNLVETITACAEKKHHESVVNNSARRKTDSMETYQMDGEGNVCNKFCIKF